MRTFGVLRFFVMSELFDHESIGGVMTFIELSHQGNVVGGIKLFKVLGRIQEPFIL